MSITYQLEVETAEYGFDLMREMEILDSTLEEIPEIVCTPGGKI